MHLAESYRVAQRGGTTGWALSRHLGWEVILKVLHLGPWLTLTGNIYSAHIELQEESQILQDSAEYGVGAKSALVGDLDHI